MVSSDIRKFTETETSKKNSYIAGNGNPKNTSYILGNVTFQSTLRRFLILLETEPPKKFPIVSQEKAFLVFPETETQKKIAYVSGNKTFLHFRKRKA